MAQSTADHALLQLRSDRVHTALVQELEELAEWAHRNTDAVRRCLEDDIQKSAHFEREANQRADVLVDKLYAALAEGAACSALAAEARRGEKEARRGESSLRLDMDRCEAQHALAVARLAADNQRLKALASGNHLQRKLELGIMQMAVAARVSETKSAVDTYLVTDWSYHKYSYARNLMAAADPLMLDAIDSALQGAQPVDVPINIAEVSFDTLYGLRDGSHLEMMRLVQGGPAPPPPRDEGQRRSKAAVEDAPAQDDMDVDAAPPAKDQTPETATAPEAAEDDAPGQPVRRSGRPRKQTYKVSM